SLLLVCGSNQDEAAVGTGDRTLDKDNVILRIDPDYRQVAHGDASGAVMAGHADAALRPTATTVTRVGGNRAVLTIALLDAVTAAETLEVVPFHHAGEAAPLRAANDIDRLDILEHRVGGEQVANLRLGRLVEPKLLDVALRLAIG